MQAKEKEAIIMDEGKRRSEYQPLYLRRLVVKENEMKSLILREGDR